MSRIRAKDTSPELALRRALWSRGHRGYRLHARGIAGRPDIAFPRARVAIFVHGCFWHACPTCQLRAPRSNSKFWREKFQRNVERDGRKIKDLEAEGWRVVVVWEHEVRDALETAIRRVEQALAG